MGVMKIEKYKVQHNIGQQSPHLCLFDADGIY